MTRHDTRAQDPAHWVEYETHIDGAPVRIVVDTGAGAELAQLDLPNLLQVQLREADCAPRDAGECLQRLQEELQEWFTALGGRIVARAQGAGLANWFIYLSCGWLEAANLVHRIGLRCGLVLGAHMRPDPRHRLYHEWLLPSRAELLRAHNARQCARLLARLGEDAARRQVALRHAVAFANHTQALAFARWARQNGFRVDGVRPPAENENEHVLQFSASAPLRPAVIDALTHGIDARARCLGGSYLGWQAAATPPREERARALQGCQP